MGSCDVTCIVIIIHNRYWCFKGGSLGLLDITDEVVTHFVSEVLNVWLEKFWCNKIYCCSYGNVCILSKFNYLLVVKQLYCYHSYTRPKILHVNSYSQALCQPLLYSYTLMASPAWYPVQYITSLVFGSWRLMLY